MSGLPDIQGFVAPCFLPGPASGSARSLFLCVCKPPLDYKLKICGVTHTVRNLEHGPKADFYIN